LPLVAGASHAEKQVSWPLEKALPGVFKRCGELVVRWRKSLACQLGP